MKKIFCFLLVLYVIGVSVVSAGDRAIIRGALGFEARQALVIGNAQYLSSSLKNPVKDAIDMSKKLKSLGFTVTSLLNANLQEMILAVQDFGKILAQGGVGLFYYAGHGLQLDGKNFLVPVDANLQNEGDAEFEALDVSRLLKNLLLAENRLNIVILDACRDNPFFQNHPFLSRGFTQLNAPSGTIVAFSTAPGNVSADGDGKNGLFTKHLLNHMSTPDLELGQMFRRVRDGVIRESDNHQIPWESSSLTGDFYFMNISNPLHRVSIKSAHKNQNTLLTVKTQPGNANVSILNISPLYYSKMQIPPGHYQIEVTAANYIKHRQWYKLNAGHQTIEIDLQRRGQKGRIIQDCKDCPEMVILPNKKIALGKYEVTQSQWKSIMASDTWFAQNRSEPSDFKRCGEHCPVEKISWNDIQEFIERLNAKTGQNYRLPTEKEWQESCLADLQTRFCGSNKVNHVAWHEDNADSRTHAVGEKKPNAWGLYDMTGNVWEWVNDCFDPECNSRILRGGAWNNTSLFVRSVDRIMSNASARGNNAGFRLALSLD